MVLGVKYVGVQLNQRLVVELLIDVVEHVMRIVQMATFELAFCLQIHQCCMNSPLLISDDDLRSPAHRHEEHPEHFDVCICINFLSDRNPERNKAIGRA